MKSYLIKMDLINLLSGNYHTNKLIENIKNNSSKNNLINEIIITRENFNEIILNELENNLKKICDNILDNNTKNFERIYNSENKNIYNILNNFETELLNQFIYFSNKIQKINKNIEISNIKVINYLDNPKRTEIINKIYDTNKISLNIFQEIDNLTRNIIKCNLLTCKFSNYNSFEEKNTYLQNISRNRKKYINEHKNLCNQIINLCPHFTKNSNEYYYSFDYYEKIIDLKKHEYFCVVCFNDYTNTTIIKSFKF